MVMVIDVCPSVTLDDGTFLIYDIRVRPIGPPAFKATMGKKVTHIHIHYHTIILYHTFHHTIIIYSIIIISHNEYEDGYGIND